MPRASPCIARLTAATASTPLVTATKSQPHFSSTRLASSELISLSSASSTWRWPDPPPRRRAGCRDGSACAGGAARRAEVRTPRLHHHRRRTHRPHEIGVEAGGAKFRQAGPRQDVDSTMPRTRVCRLSVAGLGEQACRRRQRPQRRRRRRGRTASGSCAAALERGLSRCEIDLASPTRRPSASASAESAPLERASKARSTRPVSARQRLVRSRFRLPASTRCSTQDRRERRALARLRSTTAMSPPMARASCIEMARPRPVPPLRRSHGRLGLLELGEQAAHVVRRRCRCRCPRR